MEAEIENEIEEEISESKEMPRIEKEIHKPQITIWRLFAYFIIYSILGYIIETTFAFIVYGVIESRQSFLYGPFCAIYGLGAAIMIPILRRFDKSNYTLFIAGFILGSIIEYLVSWSGEILLNTRWWDYSNRFLNINGRICVMYSIFWGLLATYLMKQINPKIDQLINWTASKFKKTGIFKAIIIFVIVFMFVDCVISVIAQNWVLTKVTIENNLNVNNIEAKQDYYNKVYSNENTKNFVDKHWSIENVLFAYPNLSTCLADGTQIKIRDLYPDIHPYLYKMQRN